MVNKLLFPWIIVIQTIVLLVTIGIAYSAQNEAIESAVGPHLLHIVTISLLLITFITPTREAKSYARVYAWTNLGMDNIALFVMLFRYSQREALKLGDEDLLHLILYIVSVLLLIMVDIHNITFTWDATDDLDRADGTVSKVGVASEAGAAGEAEDAKKFETAGMVVPAKLRKLSIKPDFPRIVIKPMQMRNTRKQHPSLLKLV